MANIAASWSAFALHSVALAWDPSTKTNGIVDTNVVGYWVYYGPAAGYYTNRADARTNLSLTISNLTDGAFYFTATARTAQGVESDYANVVQTNLLSLPAIVSSPVDRTVAVGSNASFYVSASGGFLSYQWFSNGVALNDSAKVTGSGTPALTIQSVLSSDTGTYSVVVSNALGTARSADAVLSLVGDTSPPSVAVTWPSTNTTVSNGRTYANGALIQTAPQLAISGSATDSSGITNVIVTRVIPPWAPLTFTPTLVGSATSKQWTNIVQLVDGTNKFRVVATDGTGRTNFVERTIYLKTTNRLTVIVQGPGVPIITSAARNGAVLDIGKNYTISAAPKTGNWFVNWTNGSGGVLTNNANLTFTMASNLVLVANFITNGIIAGHLAGAYNGLFSEVSGATPQSAGSISNFVIASTRVFSAKVCVAGGTHLLSGTLDTQGNIVKTITRASKPSLSVSLHLDMTNGTRQLTGTVSCVSEGWSSPLRADQAYYSATVHNPMASRYTMAIPPIDAGNTNIPLGYGYGLITNGVTGMATMTGALADLTQITYMSPISKNGDWPVCIGLYSHQGLLHGWVNFSNGAPTGRLVWIKPPATTTSTATAKLFKAELDNSVDVFGSAYRSSSPVALNSGALDLKTPVTNAFYGISFTNSTTITSTNHISGTVNTTTGLITLSLPPAVTGGVTRNAYAVVLQNSNAAVGVVSGTNASIYLH